MVYAACATQTGDNFVRPWSHGGNVAQVMAATALGQLDYSVTGVPVEGKLARIRKGDGHSKRKDMVCTATTTAIITAVYGTLVLSTSATANKRIFSCTCY
jgi:hypothetical protein